MEPCNVTVDPQYATSYLKCEHLTKAFRQKKVVNDVDIEVRGGEVVGLLGPNGAGKTTIFYMIVGLLQPNAGRIHLNGGEVTSLPMYLRARKGIGYLAQEPSVFRKLTVEGNLMAILETLPISREERKDRLEDLLNDLGLSSLRKQKAFSLSGGERRRVEITRALVLSPSFILLDEPFAGIDPIAVLDIQGIVCQLKSKGIGIIITDHNVRETLGVCDRAYIINEGRILEGILIADSREQENFKVIVARKGELVNDSEGLKTFLRLSDGSVHFTFPKNPALYRELSFGRYELVLDFGRFLGNPLEKKKRDQEMTLSELLDKMHDEKAARLHPHIFTEFHKKFSIPFAALVFVLIGTPLGIRVKRSGKVSGLSLSVALVLVYYLLFVLGETLGKKGRISPFLAVWVPNILLGGLGTLFLCLEGKEKWPEWSSWFRR